MGSAGIRRISDPMERGRQAAAAMAELKAALAEMQEIRDGAIRQALAERWKGSEIAEAFDVSPGRVYQIARETPGQP